MATIITQNPAQIQPHHLQLLRHSVETQLPHLDDIRTIQLVNRHISCAAQADRIDKSREFLHYLSQTGLPQAFLHLTKVQP